MPIEVQLQANNIVKIKLVYKTTENKMDKYFALTSVKASL